MKRKEAERILIAEAIKRGNISFLVSEDFDPSYFEHHRDLVDGLWKKVDELNGYTPSRSSAEQAFPNFDFTPTSEEIDVTQAVIECRKAHAHDLFNRELMKLKPMIQEPGGWEKALKQFPAGLTKIENILETSSAKDFALNAPERQEYVRQRAIQRDSGNWKVNFAHPGLNDHFGGYEAGFYMYVARTGKGKTWTCLLDLWWSWMQGANVGIFSLEMDFYKVGLRLDTFESHFSNYDLNRGIIRKDKSIDPEDQEAIEQQSNEFTSYLEKIKYESEQGIRGKFKIWPMDMFHSAVTPRRIEALVRDENLDFVVIDQLELVDSNSGNTDERTRLNEVSREFKRMAGRLNIPILVPHQMNRETVKAKEVTDANIAGSDGPGRHADFICHLTRDDKEKIMYYNFLKGRNAPTDTVFALEWDWDTGIYKPVDPQYASIERMGGLNRNEELLEEDREMAEAVGIDGW